MSSLGVFGGSFDPPHVGHVALAAMATAAEGLDRLLVIPCFQHALGKELTPFEDRFAMCRLAFGGLAAVEVSDLERHLGGTSYTVDTLEHLRREDPRADLHLIVGADAVEQRHAWRHFDRIRSLATLVVFARDGHHREASYLPAPPAVSATEVRRRLRAHETVRGLLPRTVLQYIETRRLYTREEV